MELPVLQRSNRSREYNNYNDTIRDHMVYLYLFEGKSYREIDEIVINQDSDYSHRWQSMGVLHHIGVTRDFKNIFSEVDISDAIKILVNNKNDSYTVLVDSLKRYYNILIKDKKSEKALHKNWIISANPKIYNHAKSFAARGYIDWRQKVKYSIGDNVYIYCTRPYKKVMYKTIVEKINMPFDEISDDKEFWLDIKEYDIAKDGAYCRLKLIEQVDTQILSLSNLIQNGLKAAPQGPMKLNKQLHNYIDRNFNDYYFQGFFNDIPDTIEISEGLKKTVTVNRYERSSIARSKCIEHHGCYCHVCGLNFKEVYGELGTDFIHVHHLKPLSEIDDKYVVDYKNDLIPICPNCHAMIHRKIQGKEVTIEQLKEIYRKNKI